ncbi:MAG TPA: 4'-phosphopantetheinyl transferase superfamily protein [Thermoanaerobaculia bacterium]|jgi:phosphopantetheinyl transferase
MNAPWPGRCLILAGGPDLALFAERELAQAREFKLPKRRDEWLLSRAAAKQLALQLGLAVDARDVEVERPSLVIGGERTRWHVSLSHSAPYAAAAIAREPVGIDIQVIREMTERAAHLFLTAEEEEAMRGCTLPHRLLHFWCAKEAAFKQRSNEFTTMRQLPMTLLEERESGLLFDAAETVRAEDAILAITRPTSSAAP